ncbi:MAG TPA: 30S ribosomal protein S7, partial [Patescibacteria group bacterium]|nr:30S ribosomal protein S7 [Patescibacteria group bacterium]
MRHAKVTKRKAEPDQLYNSVLVAKFINNVMKDGKKTI